MGRFREITVQVDVMVDDVIEELKDDELTAEVSRRGLVGPRGAVQTAIAQIRRGDTLDAITTLEREFWPKWASVADSEAAFRGALVSTAVKVALANDNQEAAIAASATS